MTLSPLTSEPDWAGKMIKKTLLLFATLGLLMMVLSPVRAQTEMEVPEASAYANFPYSIEFNLIIECPIEITDVRLHYIVDRESFAKVTSEVKIGIVPDTSIDASWSWDMIKTGGMPSGTVVEYWWTITDANGNSYITTREQINYDDSRYHWRSLTEGNISLHWYYGNEPFAQELMAAAQEAMARPASLTSRPLPERTSSPATPTRARSTPALRPSFK